MERRQALAASQRRGALLHHPLITPHHHGLTYYDRKLAEVQKILKSWPIMPLRQKQPRTQPMRVYESGKRHMELIASVSRSSGLEKDGDA